METCMHSNTAERHATLGCLTGGAKFLVIQSDMNEFGREWVWRGMEGG